MVLKMIAVYLPPEHIEKLDQLVQADLYSSRNEAIRVAVQDLLRAEADWGAPASDRLLRDIERRRT